MKKLKKLFTSLVLVMMSSSLSFAQSAMNWQLEKMPVELETEFALSALPVHLREEATVYLLDPKKGYYIGKQGTNGFGTFVNRTEWEWAENVTDSYTAISYDAEGVKTYLPVYFDVAEMRASGKFTPQQIKDIIIGRVKNGTYKAPSRPGVSYMLSPMHRTHVDEQGVINQTLPHYMFYAPCVDNSDIGGQWDGHGPFAINSGDFLEKKYSIFNYIIIPAGEAEKKKIVDDNNELYKKLVAYKAYFKREVKLTATGEHRH